ncbi:MAG: Tyrosyl-tRNA synthetase [Brockia lithotrophica]|uniref:Tyrosine--tRNA ligase n=1 Tax=Brockia lithotrophica TaxID=933949 RepID=A0A2T5G7M9_9BACL|nr:MAG: Tyrosyl-tRNA synthetase [Brockia lithotrophica]
MNGERSFASSQEGKEHRPEPKTPRMPEASAVLERVIHEEKLEPAVAERFAQAFSRLVRGTAEITPLEEFAVRLARSVRDGRPLRVKLGLDPSAPDIHLGHTVVLRKLKDFQELGHVVQLVIGDFTGRIGDPTGRSETRRALTEEEVRENARTYLEQFSRVLDVSRVELHFNATWLAPLTLAQTIELMSRMTVARMLEREDFRERFVSGRPIALHEFLYPLLQGYDSVVLRCDVELGGTDQKFNFLVGRHLQESYGQPGQILMLMPLLEGLDGARKMSKSLGNYVGVQDPPEEMFGKIMSIPDFLVPRYALLLTDVPEEEVRRVEEGMAAGTVHPMHAKKDLARRIVAQYHGREAARRAEEHFTRVFQRRDLPEQLEEVRLASAEIPEGGVGLLSLLVRLGLAASTSEARRFVEQGAVRIDGERVEDPRARVYPRDGQVVQVGRRNFRRIRLSQDAGP